MNTKNIPDIFVKLQFNEYISASEIMKTQDGFWLIYKSIANILEKKGILDFPTDDGARLLCNNFYDDWFLYAVANEYGHTYGLLKLREQEHDASDCMPADGDMPGVTVSFISFDCETLLECLADPSDENRHRLDCEINRVVAYRRQKHHKDMKRYFVDPGSEGAYLIAELYIKHVASLGEEGFIYTPEEYKVIANKKTARLPRFIDSLNEKAGYTVCDNQKIYIKNREALTEFECMAILATHTGNTSMYSFAAEVEYHARFLSPFAKIKIPLLGGSAYDSAIRADMTVGDKEFTGPAPFYKPNSKIVRRQCMLHGNTPNITEVNK